MTDPVQIALIVACGAGVATIPPTVLSGISLFNQRKDAQNVENRALRAEQASTDAKKAAEVVASKLAASEASSSQKMSEIHVLVNSSYSEALLTACEASKVSMLLAQRIAATGTAEEAAFAEQAKRSYEKAQAAYDRHIAKQAKVDESQAGFAAGEIKGAADQKAKN